MKISACYIVKNESYNLPLSLASVREAADEIVVVDTGSDDDTPAVAQKEGARVFSFEWRDDFSAAKNFALEKATGDYIIFLDADESFIDPENVRAAVEELASPDVDVIMIALHNLDKDHDFRDTGIDWVLRIFRNDPMLRFSGRIHENISRRDGELRIAYGDKRLEARHTGYSSGIVGKKIKRNLDLLLADMRENGVSAWHYIFLADCCFGLLDWENARRYALAAIDSPVKAVTATSKMYHIAIESLRQMDGSLDEMERLAREGVRLFPKIPEFYGELGMVLSAKGRLREALSVLETAARLYENPPTDAPPEDRYFTSVAAAMVYARIGEIYDIYDDTEAAESAFRLALATDMESARVREKWEKFIKKHGISESSKIKISACYIVQDEEKNIARSIKSVRDAADEIVVVDTGSSDDTRDIAKNFGARVFDFKWCDDFSAAKNFALSKAAGDWVVFLDADEYFTADTEKNLRTSMLTREDKNLLLVMRTELDEDSGQVIMDCLVPRMMRRLPSLRYEGAIHEEPRLDKVNVGIVPKGELSLMHTGYSARLMQEKGRRNLALLKKELESECARDTVFMYLAETYDGLGDAANAEKYARLDIAGGRKPVVFASRSHRILLRILSADDKRSDERLVAAREAAKAFPEIAEFHAEYAECLAHSLDFEGALDEAEEAMTRADVVSPGEPQVFGEDAVRLLRERISLWRSILERAGRIKISSCLIAKDEERDFPSWAKNASAYADRCIVVDTGSSDRTKELARATGCEVYDFTWADDFSEARNFALELASGDWIAFLDADETFDAPERVRPFLAEMDVMRPGADAVRVMKINVDENDGGREIHRHMDIRLLRCKKNLRYAYRIHENLINTEGSLSVWHEPYRLSITHTGYSSVRVREKIKRNLALLKMDIAEKGEGPEHYRYLADIYAGLSDWENAEKYARLAIDAPLQAVLSSNDMYHVALLAMEHRRALWREMMEMAERAIERFPLLPEYHAWKGFFSDDTKTAEGELSRAIALHEHPEDRSGESSTFRDMAYRAYAALAKIFLEKGDAAMADENIKKALTENKYDITALNLMREARRDEPEEEFAARLGEFFDMGRADELSFLARWAEGAGYIRLYLYFAGKLDDGFGIKLPRRELYEEALEKGAGAVFGKVMSLLAADVQKLPAVLLKLEHSEKADSVRLYERCRSLLPAEMARVWAAYEGKGEISEGDSGAYTIMLAQFIRHGDAGQRERFESLAVSISESVVMKTAERLTEAELWAEAFSLYGKIGAGSDAVTGDFWRRVGICLYHLGEYDSAAECFTNAKSAGSDSPDIAAYEKWMAEAKNG